MLEPVVRRLIEIDCHAWVWRELALVLADLGHFDEAFAELATAQQLEPANPSYFSVRGRVCRLAGRLAEVAPPTGKCCRLSVDFDLAIMELVQGCDTLAERQEMLEFIEQELLQQMHFGDGLLAYSEQALGNLEPEDFRLVSLRNCKRRGRIYGNPGQRWCVSCWPWTIRRRRRRWPRRRSNAFHYCRCCGSIGGAFVSGGRTGGCGAEDALKRALEINPAWRRCCGSWRSCTSVKASGTRRGGCWSRRSMRVPLAAVNHGSLANLLWQQGEHETAPERLKHGLLLDRGTTGVGTKLGEWTRHLERPDDGVAFGWELTNAGPRNTRSWLMLARLLTCRRATTTWRCCGKRPLCFRAVSRHWTCKRIIWHEPVFDEALAACRPPVDVQPLFLCGRAAWVEAEAAICRWRLSRWKIAPEEDPNYFWGWRNVAEWRHHWPIGSATWPQRKRW